MRPRIPIPQANVRTRFFAYMPTFRLWAEIRQAFALQALKTVGTKRRFPAYKEKPEPQGVRVVCIWWAMRDLNPRPCACKAPALPLRQSPRDWYFYISRSRCHCLFFPTRRNILCAPLRKTPQRLYAYPAMRARTGAAVQDGPCA